MKFELKVICEVYSLMEATKDTTAKAQLFNLWKNLAHHKRATEALSMGKLHSKETLSKSANEVRRLNNADSLYKIIVCD